MSGEWREQDGTIRSISSRLMNDYKFYTNDPYMSNLIPESNVLLYRGLSFETSAQYAQFINESAENNILHLEYVTSWTSNICVAYYFTTVNPFGVILEYNTEPKDILIDTRYFDDRTLEDLYYNMNQREIILKANIKIPCRIIYRHFENTSVEQIPSKHIFEDNLLFE